MKKILSMICLLATYLIPENAAPDHDIAISFEQLPAVSQQFVKTHFAGLQVAYCLRDSHSYEARFTDGSEIEFALDGNWKEIDCKYKEVPASVIALIPAPIATYVKTTFTTALITKINIKVWGFEVELNNGLELEFNARGICKDIDD